MADSKEHEAVPDLSILGGPLHRLGERLGLVRGGTDTVRLGLALGLFSWLGLVLLAFVRGNGDAVFALTAVGVHVRLLLAVPLFSLCETWVAPRMAAFTLNLVRADVVPVAERAGLAAAIRGLGRLQASWLAEGLLLALALAAPLLGWAMGLQGPAGRTGSSVSLLAETGGKPGPALVWYLGVCLPIFRFLLLRWFWRLGLWGWFLWRLQKLELRLIPTHPDGVAGLGYVEVVQEHFTPLVVGLSAVCSASLAEGFATGAVPFEAVYRLAALVLLLTAALFIGPLLAFSPKLWRCWVRGWPEYMDMASGYVEAFDGRWIRDPKATGESQLGTADLQSLADLANSVDQVRNLRWIPVSRRLVTGLTTAALLPLLPLLLFKYPLGELAQRVLQSLTGL